MTRPRLMLMCLVLSGCATPGLPRTDMEICERLASFAQESQVSTVQVVRLSRGGNWMVDHYKTCTVEPEVAAGKRLCDYLLEETSTEFMEANVNRALACLQGQTIVGYVGNTDMTKWSGSASFYGSALGEFQGSLEVSWRVGCPACEEDFLEFKFKAPK